MNSENLCIEVIKIAIPALTSILLFILAFYRDSFVSNKEVLRERLDNLYVPFYQKQITLKLGLQISDFSNESICIISELLAKNIHYMNKETQILYINFYKLQLDFIDARCSLKDLTVISKDFNNSFDKLNNNLTKEYKYICRKLKLPTPAL